MRGACAGIKHRPDIGAVQLGISDNMWRAPVGGQDIHHADLCGTAPVSQVRVFAAAILEQARHTVCQVEFDIAQAQEVLSQNAIHAVGGEQIAVNQQIHAMQCLVAYGEILHGRLSGPHRTANTPHLQLRGRQPDAQSGPLCSLGGDKTEE